MKGFALRLALKQRHKRTRKWPIVRSKAHWHEHGEKNSKYFLHHIKKHIRKLYVSGIISMDIFTIMDAQKLIYSKFYERQQTN